MSTPDTLDRLRPVVEALTDAYDTVRGFRDACAGDSCSVVFDLYREDFDWLARAVIHETDRAIRDADTDCVAAHVPLEEANRRIAALLRTETDDLLDHVLYEASMRMHNAFSRSDK